MTINQEVATSKRPCRDCGQRRVLKADARDGIRFCATCRQPDAIERRLRAGEILRVEAIAVRDSKIDARGHAEVLREVEDSLR